MKKKLFLLLPALGLLFGMSACDNGPIGKTSGNTSRTSQTSGSTSNSSGNTGSSSEAGGSSSQTGGSSEAGGSSEEGGSSQDTPLDTPFTVKFGENQERDIGEYNASYSDQPGEDDGWKEQYTMTWSVTAGDEISFYYNDDPIEVFAGDPATEGGNNVKYDLVNHIMNVVETASDVKCYFKIFEDSNTHAISYGLWLDGNTSGTGGGNYDPTPVTTGFGLSVNGVDVPGTKTEEQSEGRDQYLVAGLNLKTNDVVKVRNLENTDAWAPEVEEASFGGNVSSYLTITESQYTVKQDCKVDVYIKIKGSAEANDAVYFGLAEAEKEFSYQIGTGSKVTFGEEEKDDNPPTGYKAQYTLPFGNVSKDTLISFFDGENALEVHAGLNEVDNNVSYNLSTKELKVVMDANEVTCYFKVGNDNGYSIWLTGNTSGEGGGDFDPTPVTTGFGLSVNGVDVPGTKTAEQSEGRDQYLVSGLELKTNDVVKVRNLENEDAWAPAVEAASFGGDVASYLTVTESQYTVKQDCKVDVYIKIKGSAEANDAVYFGFPVEPKTYSYQINSGDKTVIPETAKSDLVNDKGEKYGIQYQIGDEDIELNKGDIIKFYEDKTQFYPHAWGEKNNGVYDETTKLISVHNDVDTGTIYLKWYDDNPDNPDVWVTGFESSGVASTIYFRPNADWASSNAKFAIYYEGGTWAEGTYDTKNDVWSFNNPDGISKIIFVRVGPDTTIPLDSTWTGKWNQSPHDGFHTIPEGKNFAEMTGSDYGDWDYYPITWSAIDAD